MEPKIDLISEFFYRTHDPTTVNKQGRDRGTREHTVSQLRWPSFNPRGLSGYRSAIFYNSPAQKDIAKRVTEEVQKKHFDPHGTRVVTQIVEAGKWVDAEEYHQLYLFKNPTGYQCSTHKLHW